MSAAKKPHKTQTVGYYPTVGWPVELAPTGVCPTLPTATIERAQREAVQAGPGFAVWVHGAGCFVAEAR